MTSVAGDIIEIEHTDDHTAGTISWNLIGKTHDTVEMSPNNEVAERRHHESLQMDKVVTSEAWEITFSKDITGGEAGLIELGLKDDSSSYEYKGHADSRETGNTADAIQITVYENEADKQAGTVKWQAATSDYIVRVDTGELAVTDFASFELVIDSRMRPVDRDAGGTL